MKQVLLPIFVIIIIVFSLDCTFADPNIDSIQNQIAQYEEKNLTDSVLNTRLELIKYVRNSDFELFLHLSNLNIELAKKENLNWGQIDAYMELSEVFISKGIFSTALKYLNEALKLAEIDEYRPYVGWVSISIGNAYEGMFSYNKAISFYQKAFNVFEETEDIDGMALSSTNIGNCYNELKDLDNARLYLTKGLEYWQQIDDPVNTDFVKMYLINLKISEGNYSEAEADLTELRKTIEKLLENNTDATLVNEANNLLSVVLWSLSDCENYLGNTKKSLTLLKHAVNLNKKTGNYINLSTIYNLLGNNYLVEKEYDLAILYADSAATMAKNEKIFIEEAKSYQLFSKIYSEINNPDKALIFYKQYKSINDSIYNNSVIQAISDVDVLVETLEKEKNNQILALKYEQERKNRITGFIGTILLIIIVSIFIFIILRRYKKEKKLSNQLIIKNGQIIEQSKNMEQLNNELSVLNKSKDKFHSIIAHDLKNPTATVFSLVNLLKQQYDESSDESRKELINMADDMAERTVKLLDNLLTWSRVQEGRLTVNYSNFIISDILNESIELSKRMAEAKGITLKLAKIENITLNADKEMITTVIRNLHTNAIKFSSQRTGNHFGD